MSHKNQTSERDLHITLLSVASIILILTMIATLAHSAEVEIQWNSVAEADGYKVRIVAVLNPRRLYRPTDVAWDTVSQPDDKFMSDDDFNALFDGDVLMAVSGGPSAPLEPVMLRTRAPNRDTICWKRGETTASPAEIMEFNGITPEIMIDRVNTFMK